ncbi:MAG: hypothetical protein JO129_00350 [Candidatus Dependentiae bacterium]|nr:hypothetical protein [Candidatus Dependentiae bacterium]
MNFLRLFLTMIILTNVSQLSAMETVLSYISIQLSSKKTKRARSEGFHEKDLLSKADFISNLRKNLEVNPLIEDSNRPGENLVKPPLKPKSVRSAQPAKNCDNFYSIN